MAIMLPTIYLGPQTLPELSRWVDDPYGPRALDQELAFAQISPSLFTAKVRSSVSFLQRFVLFNAAGYGIPFGWKEDYCRNGPLCPYGVYCIRAHTAAARVAIAWFKNGCLESYKSSRCLLKDDCQHKSTCQGAHPGEFMQVHYPYPGSVQWELCLQNPPEPPSPPPKTFSPTSSARSVPSDTSPVPSQLSIDRLQVPEWIRSRQANSTSYFSKEI